MTWGPKPEQKPPDHPTVFLRIGIIGGGELCRYILTKGFREYKTKYVQAKFVAVADPDDNTVGMRMARKLGLYTTNDFHDFYRPELDINQIFIFTPEEWVLEEVLATRPQHIRLLGWTTARMLWDILRLDETMLMAERDQLMTIVNGIQDGILVLDRNYKIIQANQPLLEKVGLTEEEILRHKCHEIFHLSEEPCAPPDHPCPLREALKTEEPVNAVHRHYTTEGEERIIDLTLYPVKDIDGKITRFIEIIRDVTERHRQQEEMTRALEKAVAERTQQLEESHRKLLQQDKMSSLGKLSASVVHELNNPLTGILTFTRLVQRTLAEKELTPKVIDMLQGHLELMKSETSRCSRIVSNLLAFARRSKLEPEKADLNQLLDRIVELNAHHLELQGVEAVREYQPGLPQLFGDISRLQQVFMNIIFNAAEAIPEERSGRLTVATSLDQDEDMLLTRITDTGAGIPEDNLPHIFEPFFTTKSEGKGVGLGLSVVYGIVKEHRGQIEVEKTGPGGTTFLVKLPVFRPNAPPAGDPERQPPHRRLEE